MILNNKLAFWLLLSVPAMLAVGGWSVGRIETIDMLHPTGEWSARFMILAMMIGPLMDLFGAKGWTRWLFARRRYLGLAAFFYALSHLIFYIIDMGELAGILDELTIKSIWTGWLALLLMLPMALTSNDRAMQKLKAGWKRVQRLVYPAAILTLLHWFWIHDGFTAALIHFAPLMLLLAARFVKNINQ
jgi:methionine sulfoxide reductase heme-binding subunit